MVACRTQRQDIHSGPFRTGTGTGNYRILPRLLGLLSWLLSLGLLVSRYSEWLFLLREFVTVLATSVSALCGRLSRVPGLRNSSLCGLVHENNLRTTQRKRKEG